MDRVRVESIEIRDFLGAGDDGLHVDFGGEYGVLCGPNNSGKTTVLQALSLVSGLKFGIGYSNNLAGRAVNAVSVNAAGVPQLADALHWDAKTSIAAETCIIKLVVRVPTSIQNLGELLRSSGFPVPINSPPVKIAFEVSLTAVGQAGLTGLWVADHHVFAAGRDTDFFTHAPNTGWYVTDRRVFERIFETVGILSGRIMFIPSWRSLSSAEGFNLQELAADQGVIGWIAGAANPDARDPRSRRRNQQLRDFERGFAEFAGFKTLSLSVTPSRNEINATVNGHLRPLSRLGAGIGECLLILLVSMLASEGEVPIDVILLEEPELHLHPALQRKLLDRLRAYDVQLLLTTHSPTVINQVTAANGRVFRTEFDDVNEMIRVRRVSEPGWELLSNLGVSLGDVLLADKLLSVEGANDIPVFRAWLQKAPSYGKQRVTILPLHGSDAASPNFDAAQLRTLHPNVWAILDSERRGADGPPDAFKANIQKKLEAAGIRCHLTERRATESYFTTRALEAIYSGVPAAVAEFGDPNLATQGVKQFLKSRNGEVAEAMQWEEIENTDLGQVMEDFLKS